MAYTSNPSIWEAEKDRSEVQGQTELHSKILSQNNIPHSPSSLSLFRKHTQAENSRHLKV